MNSGLVSNLEKIKNLSEKIDSEDIEFFTNNKNFYTYVEQVYKLLDKSKINRKDIKEDLKALMSKNKIDNYARS